MHVLAMVAGAGIALAVTAHIVRTLVIPRGHWTALSQVVDSVVDMAFGAVVRPFSAYERRDQVLAAQGSVLLLGQLATWLLAYEVAYSLLLWPEVRSFPRALEETGSSMLTLGFLSTGGAGPTTINVLAAATGLVVVALQIAYLPTL